MTRPKIFIAGRFPEEAVKYVAEFCDYEMWEHDSVIPREVLLDKLSDKDGAVLTGIKVDEELLSRAPRLKVAANVSVGYNNFDINAMKAKGVIGTHTPYVLDDTVADLIFGLVLSSARRITELDRYVKEGRWKTGDEKSLYGVDVNHAVMGIIGMGRIGEAVAKRARFGFEMEVLYYNRNRKPQAEETLKVKYCAFGDLLKKSDFIVVMTPLTSETYHLIDTEEFNMMKSTAIFINASRGQTVNEQAMFEALENKRILGAGLDVYNKEPVSPDNPLLKLPNVVTLPHIGSATEKTRFNMAMRAAENLVKGVLGENPPNIVPELRK